jgi:hypothetical protein
MSKETTDTIIADVAFVILVYVAAEVAFKAYRSSKRRRMAKRAAVKTGTVLKVTMIPAKAIKAKVC